MNLFLLLFVSLPFLGLIEGTVQFKALLQNEYDTPIALIRKKGSTRLKLAAPVNYEIEKKGYWDKAFYTYNDSADEHGPAEEFRIACPSSKWHSDEERIEKEWKEKNSSTKYGPLFFVEEDYWMNVLSCSGNIVMPSVQKLTDEEGVAEACGQSQAEMWGVGFPISDKKEENTVQFLPVYKACYSDRKKLLYTVHHLNSPNLLLLKMWEYYELDPFKKTYSSVLDPEENEDNNMESLYQNRFAYQFVSDDDMPTRNLHRTTFFRFNYFPIPKHRSLLRSMIRADNYIRLYSKETEKPLTIYSGTSKKTILRKPHHCAPEFLCKPVPFAIDFFWRIIKDEENNAIVLVTQLTQVKCDEKTYICHENRVVLRSYWWHGSCIYTCSVNNDIIELLKLPSIEITGTLDLSFTKKIEPETKTETETETTETPKSSTKPLDAKPPAKANMQDFMSNKTFMLALLAYDAGVAGTVVDQNPRESLSFFDVLSSVGSNDGGGSWWGGIGGDVGGGGGGGDGGGGGGGGGD